MRNCTYKPLPIEPSEDWWNDRYIDDVDIEEQRRQEDYDRYLAGSCFTIPKHLFWQPKSYAWMRFKPWKRTRPFPSFISKRKGKNYEI